MSRRRLKVAFIGTGRWATLQHLPVIRALRDHLELVCIYGRTPEKTTPLANEYQVPGYTNLDEMFDRHPVDFCSAIANCSANYELASQVARRGYSCILETPIELDLKKAHALFELERTHGVQIEISENGFRKPMERIARKLLDEGIFGRVMLAYSDLCGHGYHGISMLRNYIGFAAEPASVTAHDSTLATGGAAGEPTPRVRLGIVEFKNHAVGLHSFGYSLPFEPSGVRKRFVAEKGWLAETEGEFHDGKQLRKLELRRIGKQIEGVDVCQRVIASTSPEIVWENPFAHLPLDDQMQSVASVVMSMARAVSEGVPAEYSLKSALMDYEIASAMCSSNANGRRISFPLDLEQIADERRRKLY